MYLNSAIALIVLLSWLSPTANADIVIVTHPDTKIDSVTTEQIRARWLSETNLIGDLRITVADIHERNPIRGRFYQRMINMSDRQLKAYWAKKVFMGEGFPPDSYDNSEAILEWVSSERNRVAYIDSKKLNKTVKVLYTDPPKSGEKDESQK